MGGARVVGLGLAMAIVLAAHAAFACGIWHLDDVEKGYTLDFEVAAVRIMKGDKRLGSEWFANPRSPATLQVVSGKRVVLAIKGKTIVYKGKPIATIDGDTVTFGKTSYTLDFGTQLSEDEAGSPLPSWPLTVKRGDKVILRTDVASTFCTSDSQDDPRRRVMFYLAWRHGYR